ncbi:MAG TPA: flagellar hook-associated protein FlgL [Desulfuromonadales bacterium]|nr:flagellar hook-associated protein FlgL [Desulfuromonadales bacterium]
MRITQNMTANNAVYNLQQGQARLDKLQNLVSAGQMVSQPSDDPISGRLLLDIGDKLKAYDQYASNNTKATSWLKFTGTALQGLTDVVYQARNVAAKMNNGSTDPNIRQSAHDQLVELKKQLIDAANSQYGDQYVFGGANNLGPPFSNANNNYAGDSAQLAVEIANNTSQAISVTGDRLLKGTTTPAGIPPTYGTVDVMQTFDDLIAAVGDLATPTNVANMVTANQNIEGGAKQLSAATSDILSRTTRLDNMATLNENNKNTLLSITTNIQEVDYARLGVELSNQKMAYEASLSVTAKLSQLSLLNYMP